MNGAGPPRRNNAGGAWRGGTWELIDDITAHGKGPPKTALRRDPADWSLIPANAFLTAAQMHFLTGDHITVCSRMKHESSSSDEEHAAAKPSGTSHLPLLSSVSYRKTLRLTSEQLVSAFGGHWPRPGPRLAGPGSGCPSSSLAPTPTPGTFSVPERPLPSASRKSTL